MVMPGTYIVLNLNFFHISDNIYCYLFIDKDIIRYHLKLYCLSYRTLPVLGQTVLRVDGKSLRCGIRNAPLQNNHSSGWRWRYWYKCLQVTFHQNNWNSPFTVADLINTDLTATIQNLVFLVQIFLLKWHELITTPMILFRVDWRNPQWHTMGCRWQSLTNTRTSPSDTSLSTSWGSPWMVVLTYSGTDSSSSSLNSATILMEM